MDVRGDADEYIGAEEWVDEEAIAQDGMGDGEGGNCS
jgi:hypothetical protein